MKSVALQQQYHTVPTSIL